LSEIQEIFFRRFELEILEIFPIILSITHVIPINNSHQKTLKNPKKSIQKPQTKHRIIRNTKGTRMTSTKLKIHYKIKQCGNICFLITNKKENRGMKGKKLCFETRGLHTSLLNSRYAFLLNFWLLFCWWLRAIPDIFWG
jgi:hypothetical protein